MPSSARQKIYWDANCWLSYINGITSRLPVLDALLAESASEKGTIVLYTSALSQVEVAFGIAEQTKKILDQKMEGQIDSLWADRDAVKICEYHELIGLEARNLMRSGVSKGWSLKPIDAIHLATAKSMNVKEIHTYDNTLERYSEILEIPISEPHTPNPRLI
jgi:predicted nucleic acid-binding protein